MIGTKFLIADVVGATAKPDVVEAYAHAAEWCNEHNATIIEDGDYFLVSAIPEPPAPTPDEIQKSLTDAVQALLNSEAQKLRYDDIFTAISYEGDANSKFAAEAAAFKLWRSSVWTLCYQILDDVIAGKRPVPTAEQLIAELPELVIEYPEPV